MFREALYWRQNGSALAGDLNTLARALEQSNAERPFQYLDLLAEWRL
jgi:hypothetical protein